MKVNHGEWVTTIKPALSLGTSEMPYEAARTAEVNIDACHSVKTELPAALTTLF